MAAVQLFQKQLTAQMEHLKGFTLNQNETKKDYTPSEISDNPGYIGGEWFVLH